MIKNISHFSNKTTMLLKQTFFLLFLSFSFFAYSQTRTISGTITDLTTGNPLIGATVFMLETKKGTTSDEKGNYFLDVSNENFTLRFSYIGYENKELKINPQTENRQDIKLVPNNFLQEVVITTRNKDERITSINIGMERLSIAEIRLMPALMGEVDVIKAIQLLPGVQSTSEGSSGFSVRGGSPDQNLIVLDNTPLYNPSHMMGFFSIFNNDVVSDVNLYKGDFPFKFGGRLSSLLEVQSKNNIPKQTNGMGGIGLISSRLMLEGPISDKTSWLVAGRRSYVDLFLKLSSDEDIRNSFIYFYDLNGKITHRFSDKDRLELNVYHGIDKFGAQPGDFNYGNSAVSLTWSHTFSKNLFGKYSLNYTGYDYGLASHLEGAKINWKSSIRDWMIRSDFIQDINDLWHLNYGLTSIYHSFKPGFLKIENMADYTLPESEALEHALYISNDQKVSELLSLRYGTRFSIFQNIGKTKQTYTALEPGAGAVFRVSDNASVKANYSHNIQYLQLANNSASGSPLDVWFSASPKVKPQQVDLYSAGYFRNFNENLFETSVEVYYKNLKNVIDFAEHARLIGNENLEEEVRAGKGKAYGMELMVKKNTGTLTGFVNYTLSRSERTIPEVNKGKTYLAPFDKTHAINVVASYKLSKKTDLSATWVFASGTPTTYPTGGFEIMGEHFPIYSGRNEYRKPSYHRLDLSLNYVPNPDSKKRWQGEWNFSIYNAYNQKNPWTITYDQDKITGKPYAEMMYLFGIIPSITYNFKF